MPRTKRISPTQLLDAAAQLLPRLGFDKTTIADLAQAAGISKGAFYLSFASKEALLDALLVRELATFVRSWLTVVEDDPNGGRVGTQFRLAMQVLARQPLLLAFVRQDIAILGAYLRRVSSPLRAAANADHKRDYLAALQDAGLIRADIAADPIAHWLRALTLGLIQLDSSAAGQNDIAELIDTALAPKRGARADSNLGKRLLRDLLAPRLSAIESDKASG